MAALITFLKAFITLGGLVGKLKDWWDKREAKRLGELEQQEKQRRTDDAAIQTGIAARRETERDLAGLDGDKLRETDGFRRDG